MDYLMIVTASGKAYFVSHGTREKQRIVRREAIVTSTGSHSVEGKQSRSQLFFTLVSPLTK